MSEKKIKSRIINKHDVETNWSKATNFIPKAGELIVYDKDATHSCERLKIGDGVTVVSSLPFVSSTNDYTSAEKQKLAGIAAGANKTVVDTALSSTSTNPVQNNVVNTAISNLNTLVGDTKVSTQIADAIVNKVDKSDSEWVQIYDSGKITTAVNAFSGINVSGYKSLKIAIKCVNTTANTTSASGAVVFKCENDKDYVFANILSNLIRNTASTTGGAADFKVLNGYLVCEGSYRALTADNMLSDTEGAGADNLTVLCGGCYIKCTSPISTMMITNSAQSDTLFYGVGSRVVVWGCKL